MNPRCLTCVAAGLLAAAAVRAEDDDKKFFEPKEKPQVVSGKAEVLRQMPKKWAALKAVDPRRHEVTLLLEGEQFAKTWPVLADAEIKLHGWWGRLDQLRLEDRVWVWFDLDRKKQPRHVLMIADEMSQQEINGRPYSIEKVEDAAVTFKPPRGKPRTLQRPKSAPPGQGLELLSIGKEVYLQSSGDRIRDLVDQAGLDELRAAQKHRLECLWQIEGLPGTVTFLHPLSGEMELTLDHEAIRWGRSLQTGDRVQLNLDEPIQADVKEVRPWRERTVLRLVMSGYDQSALSLGQRVKMRMKNPPGAVDSSDYPPDIGRQRSKEERVEWFLASTYCSCNIGGDGCTGMFYTLASCNTNACGMPNAIRQKVRDLIDKGLADRQIWDELKKSQGPLMLRPHLLP